MDVGAFHDGFQWHRPLGGIGWWRIARGDAETRSHGPPTSASRRLCGIFYRMDVGAFRDRFEWHRALRDIGWWRIAR